MTRSHIDDWFGGFIANHMIRNPRSDWPVAGSEEARILFGPYKKAFEDADVESGLAKQASYDLARTPPRGKSEHLPALLKRISELKQADHDATYRPDLDSRDCRECLGSGWAIRYVHADLAARARTPDGRPRYPVGARLAIPCDCATGQSMQVSLAVLGKPLPARLSDYASFRDDWRGKYRHRPGNWDEDRGEPVEGPESIRTPAELNAYCADLSAEKRVPRREAARLDLDGAIPDPVIENARAPAITLEEWGAVPEDLAIPEDDAVSGWF